MPTVTAGALKLTGLLEEIFEQAGLARPVDIKFDAQWPPVEGQIRPEDADQNAGGRAGDHVVARVTSRAKR